jgi:hypothetical protein
MIFHAELWRSLKIKYEHATLWSKLENSHSKQHNIQAKKESFLSKF